MDLNFYISLFLFSMSVLFLLVAMLYVIKSKIKVSKIKNLVKKQLKSGDVNVIKSLNSKDQKKYNYYLIFLFLSGMLFLFLLVKVSENLSDLSGLLYFLAASIIITIASSIYLRYQYSFLGKNKFLLIDRSRKTSEINITSEDSRFLRKNYLIMYVCADLCIWLMLIFTYVTKYLTS